MINPLNKNELEQEHFQLLIYIGLGEKKEDVIDTGSDSEVFWDHVEKNYDVDVNSADWKDKTAQNGYARDLGRKEGKGYTCYMSEEDFSSGDDNMWYIAIKKKKK